MSDQGTSITIEALTRFDLKPTEVLAVTVGWPDLTPAQLEEFGQFLTDWLDFHHMPVAGVLVLPSGSSMQAITPAAKDSGLGGCVDCGAPYDRCEEALDSGDYTTDANGNHDGLCCEGCQHLAETPAVDYEIPEGGIRSQYGVTFQPGEIEAVRAAAEAAGKTTTAYLHDLAVNASTPVTVNVHMQGSIASKEDIASAIQKALRRHGRNGFDA